MIRLVGAMLLIAGVAAAASAQRPDPFVGPSPALQKQLDESTRQADSLATRSNQKELKKDIKTFRMELNYNAKGNEDKPFYRLILSVPPIAAPLPRAGERGIPRGDRFCLSVQISEEQAGKIIDYGAQNLVLLPGLVGKRVPIGPAYTLQIGKFSRNLGWGLPMLHRLDALRKVLDGKAAKEMDVLLGRMSGLRKQWQKEETEDAKEPRAG